MAILPQVFLHGEGIHSTAVQLEYHSLEEEETGGRLSPVQPNGEGEDSGGPCRVRCPKVQKRGDRQEEGGAAAPGGMMWVDCEMGRCCDEPGRTR